MSGEGRSEDRHEGGSRFRERRSAHADEADRGDEPDRAAAPADAGIVSGERQQPPETPIVGEAPETGPAPEAGPGARAADLGSLDELEEIELPEPSFVGEIVSPLVSQALQFLGQIPLTESGERRVVPHLARHFIDLLGQIEERTRGNLPDEEARYLSQALSELRVLYVQATK